MIRLQFKIIITFFILSIVTLKVFAGNKTIAIDLDGVLNNYTKFDKYKIPSVKSGAKEFIKTLYNKNYKLILYTNRSPKLATEWLINNNLDRYFDDVTNVKPVSHIYIDDRAINFSGNYDKTLTEIENFKVYWSSENN